MMQDEALRQIKQVMADPDSMTHFMIFATHKEGEETADAICMGSDIEFSVNTIGTILAQLSRGDTDRAADLIVKVMEATKQAIGNPNNKAIWH